MRLTAKHGRLSVTLRAVRQGQDLQVICSGGEAHIGAVALASPHPSTEVADGKGFGCGQGIFGKPVENH